MDCKVCGHEIDEQCLLLELDNASVNGMSEEYEEEVLNGRVCSVDCYDVFCDEKRLWKILESV